ncbi:MAG: type II secretion system minor pseudopilin GspH [Steroidobacteraceae bacterium]
MSAYRGFTLLEMLVVITIVGILISGAVLSLSLVGRDTSMQDELQRLQRQLLYARDRAEIEQRPYGVLIEAKGYRVLLFETRATQWQETNDGSLTRVTLADGLAVELDVDGRKVVIDSRERDLAPQIGIDASGEFTAFELRLRRVGSDEIGWLRPDVNGALEWGMRP